MQERPRTCEGAQVLVLQIVIVEPSVDFIVPWV